MDIDLLIIGIIFAAFGVGFLVMGKKPEKTQVAATGPQSSAPVRKLTIGGALSIVCCLMFLAFGLYLVVQAF